MIFFKEFKENREKWEKRASEFEKIRKFKVKLHVSKHSYYAGHAQCASRSQKPEVHASGNGGSDSFFIKIHVFVSKKAFWKPFIYKKNWKFRSLIKNKVSNAQFLVLKLAPILVLHWTNNFWRNIFPQNFNTTLLKVVTPCQCGNPSACYKLQNF